MNRRWLSIAVILFFLTGCVGIPHQTSRTPKATLFFPDPPEEPKLQFLTSFSSSKDIEQKASGFSQFIFGKEESPQKPIIKPYGVRVRNGKIFVCDTVSNAIEILNLNDRTFQYFRPQGRQQLLNPINLDVDDHGQMFIADARRGQVLIFNDHGDFISSIGNKGEFKPTDVVAKGDRIYISDLKTNSVRMYDPNGNTFLYAIPNAKTAKKGQLFSPINIDVDKEGNIYVSDLGAFNVKKFNSEGVLLKVIGNIGDSPGSFARPKGIAVDREGHIYVVDAAFNNVQIFDSSGKLLLFFPESNDELQLVLPAGITIDYDHLEFFRPLIDKNFDAQYLVLVASQYGERKINVFAFGKKRAP